MRQLQVLLTDRFAEGLMLLRNLFGWHLIDMSYVVLNETSSRMRAPKKDKAKIGGVKGYRPSFEDLSIQVTPIPEVHMSMESVVQCRFL